MLGSGDAFLWLNLNSAPSSGWKVLAEKEEEQRGRQTLTWRPQVKGEPNHRPSSLPGAWECGTAVRGRRPAEGERALQESRWSLRSQIWTAVRDTYTQIHENLKGHSYNRQHRGQDREVVLADRQMPILLAAEKTVFFGGVCHMG